MQRGAIDDTAHVPRAIDYKDIDLEAASEWVFPSSVENRPYWKAIIRTALLKNVLAADSSRQGAHCGGGDVQFLQVRRAHLSTVKLLADGIRVATFSLWRRRVRLSRSRWRRARMCAVLRRRTLQ